MPRPSKPYFRKQTKSWYCSIQGRQISLGKDRESAFEKFHQLMADKSQVRSELNTLYELSQAYLDWCEGKRILFSHDPNQAKANSFFASEIDYLEALGYKFKQINQWVWEAYK